MLKKFTFFFCSSYLLASTDFGIFQSLSPNSRVFGVWFRMYAYHQAHPYAYIALPCLAYGLLASWVAVWFYGASFWRRVFATGLMAMLAVAISSPLGGMLWHYHDMQSGFFPKSWVWVMMQKGVAWGLLWGWLVVGLSIPYNLLGLVVCYGLTWLGGRLFRKTPPSVST